MISDSERERKTGLFKSEIKRKKESTTNCFVESILQGFMSQFPKQRGFSCSIWSCDLDVAIDSSRQRELSGLNSSYITTQDYQITDYFRIPLHEAIPGKVPM